MFKFLNKINVLSVALLGSVFISNEMVGKSSKQARSQRKSNLENKNKIDQMVKQLVMYVKQQMDANNVLGEEDLKKIIADLGKDDSFVELLDMILNVSETQNQKAKEFMDQEAFWRNALIASFATVATANIAGECSTVYSFIKSLLVAAPKAGTTTAVSTAAEEQKNKDDVSALSAFRSSLGVVGWISLLASGYKYFTTLNKRSEIEGGGSENMEEVQQQMLSLVAQAVKKGIDAKGDGKKK